VKANAGPIPNASLGKSVTMFDQKIKIWLRTDNPKTKKKIHDPITKKKKREHSQHWDTGGKRKSMSNNPLVKSKIGGGMQDGTKWGADERQKVRGTVSDRRSDQVTMESRSWARI